MRLSSLFVLLGFIFCCCLIGCAAADDEASYCVRDEQCGPGKLCADGRCFRELPAIDVAQAPDRGPDLGVDLYVLPDGPVDDTTTCRGNSDGVVERNELLFIVPTSAKTIVVENVELNFSSSLATWDLSQLTATKDGTLGLAPLPAWVDASDYPKDVHASELSSDYGVFSKARLLGVFQINEGAYQLHGLVSEEKSHTRITYDEPLAMLQFPLKVGQSFSSSAAATGYSDLFPVVYFNERYDVSVIDRHPVKIHPKLTLDALLLRVEHTVSQPLAPLFTQRHVAFLLIAECYGTVARILTKRDPKDLSQIEVESMWRIAGL
jgi:hypothetical protein